MPEIYLKKKMLQICIIAKDCYRLNENWAKLLGKKMVGLSRYEGSEQTLETEYHGKMVSGLGLETNTFDLAGNGKSIQFEILAALNGPSEWNDYMMEHSKGIHHIAFGFTEDDFDRGLTCLKKNTGMDRVQRGSPYSTPAASYAYLATKKAVGTTVEILGFGDMGEQAARYREISAMMSSLDDKSAPLAAMVPSDVTLIVEDIERSLSAFVPLFNDICPEIQRQEITYTKGGKTETGIIRTACMDMESAYLRFLEPVSGKNGWSDYAKQWRTGLYSIAFDVADLAKKQRQLTDCHMEVLQAGHYMDGTEYILMDGMEDYGAVIELRSSNQIRERLNAAETATDFTCHKEFRYNETTPVKEIVASDAMCAVMDKYLPNGSESIKANMSIAYRMPLEMVLRMSGVRLSEDGLLRLLQELNSAGNM